MFQEDTFQCVTAHVLVSCWLGQTQGHVQSQYRRGCPAQMVGRVTHQDHFCHTASHSPAQNSPECGQLAQGSAALHSNLFPCVLRWLVSANVACGVSGQALDGDKPLVTLPPRTFSLSFPLSLHSFLPSFLSSPSPPSLSLPSFLAHTNLGSVKD